MAGLLMLYQFLVDCPEQFLDQYPVLCNQIILLGYGLISGLEQFIVGVPYVAFFPQMMSVPFDE